LLEDVNQGDTRFDNLLIGDTKSISFNNENNGPNIDNSNPKEPSWKAKSDEL